MPGASFKKEKDFFWLVEKPLPKEVAFYFAKYF
jgi:hypothetical protein